MKSKALLLLGRCFFYGQALKGLRVQAPFGARVLSFVCCAPNDGFGPQSGLVQRGVLYAAAWGSENHTTALAGEEMHFPFGALRHHLPAPLGSVSLDSQSSTTPCESSSLATAERWDNKDPQSNPFISRTTISTGYSATACGVASERNLQRGPQGNRKFRETLSRGEVPRSGQRGKPLLERREIGLFSIARQGGCQGFNI